MYETGLERAFGVYAGEVGVGPFLNLRHAAKWRMILCFTHLAFLMGMYSSKRPPWNFDQLGTEDILNPIWRRCLSTLRHDRNHDLQVQDAGSMLVWAITQMSRQELLLPGRSQYMIFVNPI